MAEIDNYDDNSKSSKERTDSGDEESITNNEDTEDDDDDPLPLSICARYIFDKFFNLRHIWMS